MYYLVDTNVFLHSINDNIFRIANLCKNKGCDITITDTILKELEPGYYLLLEDESAIEIYTAVDGLSHGHRGIKLIRIVNPEDVPGATEELKKIRRRFYSWMTDVVYLNHLVSEGKITREDIRKQSFRYKDLGECELISIAMCSQDKYVIVTNDKGRVFLHPEQNLFDTYAVHSGITVINGQEWLEKLRS